MAKHKPAPRSPQTLQTIDLATLDTVTGGRIIPRKGPDPALIQGIQTIMQAIDAIGKQQAAGSQQMMQQLMQFVQEKRGGGKPR
jgi:hypothetical protein